MPEARLVVVHPSDDAVLLVNGALPVVLASELLSAGSRLGLPLFVVRTLRRDGEDRVTLCELIGEPPRGATWGGGGEWIEAARAQPIRPWLRRGWWANTAHRVESSLSRTGRHTSGVPRQLRHWGLSSVVRVPATGGDVVVKQTLPIFGREPHVMRLLDAADPGVVPPLLEVDDGDHWWLMEALDLHDRSAEPAGLLALQRLQSLLDDDLPPVPRRPLDRVAADLAALARRGDILFAADWNLQSTDGRLPPRGFTDRDRDALVAAIPEVERRIERLGSHETLVHGDFHMHNVGWTGARWAIFDWANACIAHPFMDLPMWLQWSREPDACLDAYLGDRRGAWHDAHPVALLWHAMTLLPLAESGDDGAAEWSAGVQKRVLQALRLLGHDA